jgi:hypothetical protein
LSYLIVAYALAVIILGGYLGLSVRSLRQLERRDPRKKP